MTVRNYKKPKIGKEVWVLVYPFEGEPSKMICREYVGWLGAETFVPLGFEDYVREAQQYRYDDYNKIWFSSLAAAKAKLKELNPGYKLRQFIYSPSVWEVVE